MRGTFVAHEARLVAGVDVGAGDPPARVQCEHWAFAAIVASNVLPWPKAIATWSCRACLAVRFVGGYPWVPKRRCGVRAMSALRTGIVGIGKMGLSHLAIASAHPDLDVVAVCDSQPFLLSSIRSHLDIATYRSFDKMLDEAALDVIFVATPTSSHREVATEAMARGASVFVEKPLTLSASESAELARLAVLQGVANQVGYHNRFVGTFREAARLVSEGAIGNVHHVDGKAFGPVITRAKGGGRTWRSRKSEGGGCLHDYASHVIDLMNFVVGPPTDVRGAGLASIYSTDVEDAVYAIFGYSTNMTGTLEANWSEPSYRKMTTTVTVHGDRGTIFADRQECRLWLRDGARFEEFQPGWNIRYITELQQPVSFYLRGEEYSAQIDSFARAAGVKDVSCQNSFASAAETDLVVEKIGELHLGGAISRDSISPTHELSNGDMLRAVVADLTARARRTTKVAFSAARARARRLTSDGRTS
jgi:scyllo-inositol 2-dehydrogenase (NADP+)